ENVTLAGTQRWRLYASVSCAVSRNVQFVDSSERLIVSRMTSYWYVSTAAPRFTMNQDLFSAMPTVSWGWAASEDGGRTKTAVVTRISTTSARIETTIPPRTHTSRSTRGEKGGDP